MKCDEFRQQLTTWLSKALVGEWEHPAPPPALSEHAEACGACAARLAAARLSLVPESSRAIAPDGLADRVKDRLRQHRFERGQARFASDRGRGSRTLGIPWRYAGVAAVVVVALATGLVIGAGLGRRSVLNDTQVQLEGAADAPGTPRGAVTTVRVEFRLEAPGAAGVSVVGDWNGWDPKADPLLDTNGDGIWEATITLHPGREYQYQFLIDGSDWVPDPDSVLRVDDGFGGTNSVLNI